MYLCIFQFFHVIIVQEVHQASPKFTLIDCDPGERLCPGFPGDFWVYNVDIGATSSQPQIELSFLKAEWRRQ